MGFADASEFVGVGARPVKGRVPSRPHPIGPTVLRRCAPPQGRHRSDEPTWCHSSPLTAHPTPTPPTCISRTCRCRKGDAIIDIAEFELGLGLFEALTIIHGKIDSAVQPSLDACLVWLRGRLLESVMNTAAAVPDCTAAVFDGVGELERHS